MAYNMLLVDDSATVRDVIAKTLQIAGLPIGEMHHASNGQEALHILQDNWIDLVFADINMPVMNGVELVERMSRDGILGTIPVVIVSTDGSTTRIEQLMSKGVSAYIRKPFTPELLRSVVEGVLKPKEDENDA
ncbi:MAG: response regulator [Chitinivibrionales bacterium]|nr:response regulator [Chitinivibrionales bacterium]